MDGANDHRPVYVRLCGEDICFGKVIGDRWHHDANRRNRSAVGDVVQTLAKIMRRAANENDSSGFDSLPSVR